MNRQKDTFAPRDIFVIALTLIIVLVLTGVSMLFLLGGSGEDERNSPPTGDVEPPDTPPEPPDDHGKKPDGSEKPDSPANTDAPTKPNESELPTPVTKAPDEGDIGSSGTGTSETSPSETGTSGTSPSNPSGSLNPTVTDSTEAMLNVTDFSFLAGTSTDLFEDATGDGSWYQGKVRRDLTTGEVTYVWDRYKSTLDLLDKYGGIYRKNTDQKVVYLTFDVGYDNGNLAKILDVLKEKQVYGIFFCTGDVFERESNRELIRRIVDEGHLIGNHSYSHPNMITQTNEQMVSQLVTCENKLKEALGDRYTRMVYYRPPYGASCERDLALAQKMGYQTVFWSFTYKDYDTSAQPDPDTALTTLKTGLHDGCVYLLHTVSETNTKILGDFIDYVRGEGYEIRRIDQ